MPTAAVFDLFMKMTRGINITRLRPINNRAGAPRGPFTVESHIVIALSASTVEYIWAKLRVYLTFTLFTYLHRKAEILYIKLSTPRRQTEHLYSPPYQEHYICKHRK